MADRGVRAGAAVLGEDEDAGFAARALLAQLPRAVVELLVRRQTGLAVVPVVAAAGLLLGEGVEGFFDGVGFVGAAGAAEGVAGDRPQIAVERAFLVERAVGGAVADAGEVGSVGVERAAVVLAGGLGEGVTLQQRRVEDDDVELGLVLGAGLALLGGLPRAAPVVLLGPGGAAFVGVGERAVPLVRVPARGDRRQRAAAAGGAVFARRPGFDGLAVA